VPQAKRLSRQLPLKRRAAAGLVVPPDRWHHRWSSPHRVVHARWKGPQLIILGVVLVVVGLVAGIPILESIGFLLVVVGVILWILGAMGRAVGGRKHYY